MREVSIPQLNLKLVSIAPAKGAELAIMNQILCVARNVRFAVLCDIHHKDSKSRVDRYGLTIDQALRALVIQQIRGLSERARSYGGKIAFWWSESAAFGLTTLATRNGRDPFVSLPKR